MKSFGYCIFEYCNLFEIWCLSFVIFKFIITLEHQSLTLIILLQTAKDEFCIFH